MQRVTFAHIPTTNALGSQVSPAIAALLQGTKPWTAGGAQAAAETRPKKPKKPKAPKPHVGPMPLAEQVGVSETPLFDQVMNRLTPGTAIAVLNDLAKQQGMPASSPFANLPVPPMRPASGKKKTNKPKAPKKKASAPKTGLTVSMDIGSLLKLAQAAQKKKKTPAKKKASKVADK